jgi:hypothetical protein
MSVQSEDALKEVGKTAALVEDGSPLQLGASGSIDGKTFTIIGRIQYNHGLGFWNEWYLNMAEDAGGHEAQGSASGTRPSGMPTGGPAWLGEANGMYFFTRQKKDASLPEGISFDNLDAGGAVTIDKKTYYVKDKQHTKVVSGEGELPFPFESEYEAPVVDLVSQDGTFATLDFSEDVPLVFIGRAMTYRDLRMNRVRSVYGFAAADAEPAGVAP